MCFGILDVWLGNGSDSISILIIECDIDAHITQSKPYNMLNFFFVLKWPLFISLCLPLGSLRIPFLRKYAVFL